MRTSPAIGSEMALFYLAKPLDTVIVASIDSLFSIPSFRIQERIFHTLLALRTRSERSFIVQTRLEDAALLRALAEGNLIDFYRAELADRNAYGYPPATRIIKLTLEGKKPALDIEAEAVKNALSEFSPEVFSAFISKVKSLYRTHIVLRVPPERWSLPEFGDGAIDERLAGALRALPRSVALRIMPEDIL
jgi:primosomal protein N'